jgi:sensor histidine kinase regulating citrate/malate metabolism
MVLMVILYFTEVVLIFVFMRDFFPKMFELEGKVWIVYTVGAVTARLIIRIVYTGESLIAVNVLPVVKQSDIYEYYLVLLAAVWCCASVIFAVLFTRQRTLDSSQIQSSRNALEAAKNHYAELTASLEEAAALRHDIKYQLNTIAELANKKDWEAIADLLDKANKSITSPSRFCSHGIADALLNWYAKNLKSENIAFNVEAVISSDIPVASADLCVLLGNLLENARKAASESIGSQYVNMRAKTSKNMLVLEVENSYSGNLRQENGELISNKESGGHGLKSVRILCEKYKGEFLPSWTDEKFTALALLNW